MATELNSFQILKLLHGWQPHLLCLGHGKAEPDTRISTHIVEALALVSWCCSLESPALKNKAIMMKIDKQDGTCFLIIVSPTDTTHMYWEYWWLKRRIVHSVFFYYVIFEIKNKYNHFRNLENTEKYNKGKQEKASKQPLLAYNSNIQNQTLIHNSSLTDSPFQSLTHFFVLPYKQNKSSL